MKETRKTSQGLEKEYMASDENIARMKTLLSLDSVKKALQFIMDNQENSIQEQIEIASTEAPSCHEIKRANLYAKKLSELGLKNVNIDALYNTSGYIDGSDKGMLLLDAHLDTVFPLGTDVTVKRENGILYGPGILDDARGLTIVLAAIRAMKECGIKPRKSIAVLGSVQEELGMCKGIGAFLNREKDVDSVICVDGGHVFGLMYNATYSRMAKIVFHGIGGHPFNTFGKQANPITAAARAAALIGDIQASAKPKTLFATVKIGEDNSTLKAVPANCPLYIRYGSSSEEAFYKLEAEIKKCVDIACEAETKRWNKDTITASFEIIKNTPGGKQDIHMPLVESHYLAARALNEQPVFFDEGYTNGNLPISLHIPTITYGSSGRNHNVHTVEEFFHEEGAYIGAQGLLLTLLMATGVEGSIASCMDDVHMNDKKDF